jgi:two-component sensor histidine kinase
MLRAFRILSFAFAVLTVGPSAFAWDDDLIPSSSNSGAADRARSLLAIAEAQRVAKPADALLKIGAALRLAEQANDRDLILKAVRIQRGLEVKAGAYDRSLLSAIRAVTISENSRDPRGSAEDLRALSEAYDRMGSHEHALEISRKALLRARDTGDSLLICASGLDVMNALAHAGRFNEVHTAGEELLAHYQRQNNQTGAAHVLLIEAEALIERGRYSDTGPLLARAENTFRSANDHDALLRTLIAQCRASMGSGAWARAQGSLDDALSMALEHGTANVLPVLHDMRSRIAESTGDLKIALSDARRAATLEDSIFKKRVTERMLALQSLYSTQSLELENARLASDNLMIREQAARSGSMNRWALLAVVILIGATTFLITLGWKLRRMNKRARLRTQVIQRQAEEISAKNLELERQNLRLSESLIDIEEKDVLLKEIHHRVKNNLQIVNTLLRLQGTHEQDPRLDRILSDCQGRVRSMALVHEHIYRCGDLNRVNVKAHILALAEAVLRHYDLSEKVRLDLNVTYDRTTLDNLIPLTLLLNELLSNSAKHAFVGRASGRISIAVRVAEEGLCEFVYSDDGVGMEVNQFFAGGSFGIELVRTLAAQLNGTIRLLRGEGTTVQMTFGPEDSHLRKAS